MARGLGPLVPGLDIRALIAEVQARAIEELDYQLEAEAQRAFAAEFRDDRDIVVPDVVQESGTVLVTDAGPELLTTFPRDLIVTPA